MHRCLLQFTTKPQKYYYIVKDQNNINDTIRKSECNLAHT